MQEITRISAGSDAFNTLLNNGFEQGVITTIYGEAGSGKTNVALICAISAAKQGLNVAFIDTEGGFSIERAKQINPDLTAMKKIIVSMPITFEEQGKMIRDLRKLVTDNKVDVIVIDSLTMLYRLERTSEAEDISKVNLELTKQCSILSSLARKNNTAIIITNQVYSKFDERENIRMVGGDILKYWSKCIIKLSNLSNSVRKAELIKHRSLPEGKSVYFEVVNEGLKGVEEPKDKRKFSLF